MSCGLKSFGSLPLQIMSASNCSAKTGPYAIQDPSVGERTFNYMYDVHCNMETDGAIQDPSVGKRTLNYIYGVRCNMETDGGGWIVIQRRIASGTVNFYRNWEDYENGFGDLHSEFWIGLGNIHKLTTQQEVELQISVWNDPKHAITWNFSTFRIAGPENKYRLTVDGGKGDDNEAFTYHNGGYFSTFDHDNDGANNTNCAYYYQGGWWYKSCYKSNLNGRHQMSGLPKVSEIGELLRLMENGQYKVYTNSVMMIRSKTCGLC